MIVDAFEDSEKIKNAKTKKPLARVKGSTKRILFIDPLEGEVEEDTPFSPIQTNPGHQTISSAQGIDLAAPLKDYVAPLSGTKSIQTRLKHLLR